jgi:uncharacterized membrane protein YkoI
MPNAVRKTLISIAALAAAALGGSALADAARSTSTAKTTSTTAAAATGPKQDGGRHIGANGQREQALSADVAAKVKAAALAKVSGGTVERVETDVDHGSPYEAHVTKSDGTQVEVLVNKDFTVTAVNAMGHGGPGGPGAPGQ